MVEALEVLSWMMFIALDESPVWWIVAIIVITTANILRMQELAAQKVG